MSDAKRIETANALLDELGFPRGEDGIRLGPEGKPLSFTISSLTYPSYIRASELIKESLAEVGIDARVAVSDPETLYGGIVFSGKRPLDWELLVHGSMMNPDPDHFAREFAPEPPNPWDNASAFGWKNEEIQSLLRASRKEMNEARRLEMVMRAQELFAEELPVITLGHRMHPAAYRTDKFTGWTHHPVHYGGMVHPLGSIMNLLSLAPKE
jgi:peptide/nickel transport system substrate-binding protein